MVGDLVVVCGHRETTVPKLIANCLAETQNWGRRVAVLITSL